MPIHIQWDDDARQVLRYTLIGQWTWADVHSMNATQLERMLTRSPAPVHIIVDFRYSERMLPPNVMRQLFKLSYTLDTLPNIIAPIVLVGMSLSVSRVLQRARRIIAPEVDITHYADSLAQARAYVNGTYDENATQTKFNPPGD